MGRGFAATSRFSDRKPLGHAAHPVGEGGKVMKRGEAGAEARLATGGACVGKAGDKWV